MSKKKKADIIGVIFFVAALVYSSIWFYNFYQEMRSDIEEWKETTWFVFSNDLESFENARYITKQEIEKYETTTDEYNQGIYYETLNDREKVVYKSYQYALDNNYLYTYVDKTMLTDSDKSAMDIMIFLSLDSAIVQQNLSTVEYNSSYTVYNKFYWQEVSKNLDGYIVSAETFSKTRIDKVKDAINELEKVDFAFTDATTEKEKAWKIFEYVGDNVDYFLEDEVTDKKDKPDKNHNSADVKDFLYSAVFEGKTNCDGFANMYSLLCQMNGLQCFEKVSVPGTEDEPGHTWNTVCIEGKWYNVDCTEAVYDDDDEEYIEIYELLQFGFSDALQSERHNYEDITPICSENLLPVDKQFRSPDESGVASSITQCIRESEEDKTIVMFTSFDEDAFKDTVHNVVNRLRSSVYYITDERLGATLCYIYI